MANRAAIGLVVCLALPVLALSQDAFEWRDDFGDVTAWHAQPGWLGNASAAAAAKSENGIALFTVPEPGKGMKWRRDVPNIWLPEQRFLVVRYRARNLNTGNTTYFIYVDDAGRGSECSPIRLSDVQADGAWHTIAADVLPIAEGESVRAIALQVQATDEGKACVELDSLSFSDRVPDGTQELRAEDFEPKPDVTIPLAELTWKAQPSWLSEAVRPEKLLGRIRQPSWLHNANNPYAACRGDQYTTFRVKEPGKGMKWHAPLPTEIALAGHRYISLRYRARSLSKHSDYAFCVMGRPKTEGNPGYTCAVQAGQLVVDGRWHTLTTDALSTAKKIPTVDALAVQVRATACDAQMDIAEIRFTNRVATSPVRDFLDISDGADFTGYQAVGLGKHCDADIARILKRLRITGWPKGRQVTVSGIPFSLVQGPTNCLATTLEEKGEVRIPVDVKMNEVFLLLTATYAGAEEPVYARRREGERLTTIRQIDRFKLRLLYDDRTVDECMPVCLQTKDYEVAAGTQVLCAFADRSKQLKAIELCDKTAQGSFAVSAVTCRLAGDREFADLAEETPPLRPTAKWRHNRTRVGGDLGHLILLKVNGELVRGPLSILGNHPRHDITLGGKPVVCHAVLHYPKEPWLDVTVKNQSKEPVRVQLTAPYHDILEELCGGTEGKLDPKDLYYLYPKSGAAFSNRPASFRERFCGTFPVQFMHVFNPKAGRGFFLRTMDRTGQPRHYVLKKGEDEVVLAAEYPEIVLKRGEEFKIPRTALADTGGNWHDGFIAYREWVRSLFPRPSPEKQWFREVFNFRQRFLWGHDPLYDREKGEFVLGKAIEEAKREFGGIDYLHIFDWGNYFGVGRIYGRTGDYPPYTMWKGGREAFARAIKGVQNQGVPVGLYIEGYLLSQKGLLGQKYGTAWQLIDRQDKGKMWPNSTEEYVCPFVPAWREVQAGTYTNRVLELDVDGMYIDQFGFGTAAKDCWSFDHGHPVPSFCVLGERDCTRMVREWIDGVKKGVALYTEETPCDLASIHQDGSFTYAMRRAYSTDTMVPLNIFRFAVPQFKTIEILVCDRPTGTWAEGVKWIFFNGEAMWIEGKPEWFSEYTRATIRKCYRILRKHKDAFTSLDPMPLVPTETGGVFANRFPAEGKTVYTLYNSRHRTVRGPMLKIKRKPDVRYFDAWNNLKLAPEVDGDDHVVFLEIGPRDVGCLVCTEEQDIKE